MMTDVQHNDDFTLRRAYPVPLERVWAAWADIEKKKVWFGDGLSEFDFRVGGTERSAFNNNMGKHEKEAVFFEIADRERIVYAYSMALNGRIHTVSLVTVLFETCDEGTLLRHVEQMCVMPPSDGVSGREHGWGVLLDQLADYLGSDSVVETHP